MREFPPQTILVTLVLALGGGGCSTKQRRPIEMTCAPGQVRGADGGCVAKPPATPPPAGGVTGSADTVPPDDDIDAQINGLDPLPGDPPGGADVDIQANVGPGPVPPAGTKPPGGTNPPGGTMPPPGTIPPSGTIPGAGSGGGTGSSAGSGSSAGTGSSAGSGSSAGTGSIAGSGSAAGSGGQPDSGTPSGSGSLDTGSPLGSSGSAEPTGDDLGADNGTASSEPNGDDAANTGTGSDSGTGTDFGGSYRFGPAAPLDETAGPPWVATKLVTSPKGDHGLRLAFSHVDAVADVAWSTDKRLLKVQAATAKDGVLSLAPFAVQATVTFRFKDKKCLVGPISIERTAQAVKAVCK